MEALLSINPGKLIRCQKKYIAGNRVECRYETLLQLHMREISQN